VGSTLHGGPPRASLRPNCWLAISWASSPWKAPGGADQAEAEIALLGEGIKGAVVRDQAGPGAGFVLQDQPIQVQYWLVAALCQYVAPHTLRADSQATPLRLFVGRQRERQLLLTTIGSSASSRQAVAGRPGIGKTTLVQTVKADAQAGGYWSSDEIIPISAQGAREHLLGQLLSGVYDAVLANCPTAAGPEVEAAQQLVRSIRLRGGSQSESVATPPGALLLDGPRHRAAPQQPRKSQ
jgi:hypothetical protein